MLTVAGFDTIEWLTSCRPTYSPFQIHLLLSTLEHGCKQHLGVREFAESLSVRGQGPSIHDHNKRLLLPSKDLENIFGNIKSLKSDTLGVEITVRLLCADY